MEGRPPPLETRMFHAAERVFFLLLFLCPNKEKVDPKHKKFERLNQHDTTCSRYGKQFVRLRYDANIFQRA